MPSNGRSDEIVSADGTPRHGAEHLPPAVQGLGGVEIVLAEALRAVIEKQPALAGDGSVTSTRDVPNPGYLRGTQRQIYEFLDEFLPTGQSVILTRGDQGSPFLLMSAYSAGITAAATGIGIFLFRKRDIK